MLVLGLTKVHRGPFRAGETHLDGPRALVHARKISTVRKNLLPTSTQTTEAPALGKPLNPSSPVPPGPLPRTQSQGWISSAPRPQLRRTKVKGVATGASPRRGGLCHPLPWVTAAIHQSASAPATDHGRTEASRASLAEWTEDRQVQGWGRPNRSKRMQVQATGGGGGSPSMA